MLSTHDCVDRYSQALVVPVRFLYNGTAFLGYRELAVIQPYRLNQSAISDLEFIFKCFGDVK